MCTVSNVMDGFNSKWWPKRDLFNAPEVSRAEFDALRAEIQALREEIAKARAYDVKTGQPDCESEDKIAKLREIAKLVGITNVDEIIGKGPQAREGEG